MENPCTDDSIDIVFLIYESEPPKMVDNHIPGFDMIQKI